MATFTFDQITDIIVKNPHEKLIADARTANKLFMLHTHGLGMKEAIKQEDYFENADIYKSLKAKMSDPKSAEKASIWAPKAEKAHAFADAMYTYL